MNDNQKFSIRSLLLLSGAVVLLMIVLSGYVWTQVPAGEQVCIHWNAASICDGYGSKFVGIFLSPLITVGVVGLFALLPRIDPRAANLATSPKAFNAIWVALLLFFLGLHALLMGVLLGVNVSIGTVLPVLVGLLLVVIGASLPNVNSTYLMGIRTPWTLTSDLAWRKTHRLGGRLFILIGLLMMVGTLMFPAELWVYVLLGSVLAMVIVLVIYSYIVWRSDPQTTRSL